MAIYAVSSSVALAFNQFVNPVRSPSLSLNFNLQVSLLSASPLSRSRSQPSPGSSGCFPSRVGHSSGAATLRELTRDFFPSYLVYVGILAVLLVIVVLRFPETKCARMASPSSHASYADLSSSFLPLLLLLRPQGSDAREHRVHLRQRPQHPADGRRRRGG